MESLDNANLDGVPLSTISSESIQKILWGVQHVSVYDAMDHRRLDEPSALPNFPHLEDRAVRKPWETNDESPLMRDFMSSVKRVAALAAPAPKSKAKPATAAVRPRSAQAQASASLEAALSMRDPHKLLEEALGRLRNALMRTLQRYDFRRMTGLTIAAQEFLDNMNDTQFSVFRKRVGDRYAHAVSAAIMRYSQQAQAMNERGVFDAKANAARVISMAESEAVRPQGAVHIDTICRSVLLDMITEHQLGEEQARALARERTLEKRLMTPGSRGGEDKGVRGRAGASPPRSGRVTHLLPDGDIKRWDVKGQEVAAAAVTGVGRSARGTSSPRSRSPSPRAAGAPTTAAGKRAVTAASSSAASASSSSGPGGVRHAGDAAHDHAHAAEHGATTSRRRSQPEDGIAAGLAVQSTRRNSLRRPSLLALDTKQKEESVAQRSLRVWREQQRAMDTMVSYGGDGPIMSRLWNVERGIEMTAAVLARLLEDAISESAAVYLDAVPGAEGATGSGGGGGSPGAGRRQSAFAASGSFGGGGEGSSDNSKSEAGAAGRDYDDRHHKLIAGAYRQATHPGDLLLSYATGGGTATGAAAADPRTQLNPFDRLLLDPAAAIAAGSPAGLDRRGNGAPGAHSARPGSRGTSSLAFSSAPTSDNPAVAKAGSSLATMYAHVTFAMDKKRAAAPGFKASISGLVPWDEVRRTETPAAPEAQAQQGGLLEDEVEGSNNDNQAPSGEEESTAQGDDTQGEEAEGGQEDDEEGEGETGAVEGETAAGEGEAAVQPADAAADASGAPLVRHASPKRSKKKGSSILDKVPEPSPMRWPSRDRLVKLVEREVEAEAAVATTGVLPLVGAGVPRGGSRPGSRSNSRPGSSSSTAGGGRGGGERKQPPAGPDLTGSFVVGPATILHVVDGRVPAAAPRAGVLVPPTTRKLTVYHVDNSGVAVGAPTVGVGGGVAPAAALVPAGPSTAVVASGIPLTDAELAEGVAQHEDPDEDRSNPQQQGAHAGGKPDPFIPGLLAPVLVPPKAIPLLETSDFATYSVYQRPLPFGTAVDAPDVDVSRRAAVVSGTATDPFVGFNKQLAPSLASAAASSVGLGGQSAGPGGTGAGATATGASHSSAFPSTRRRSVALKSAVEIVAHARAALLPMVAAPTYHRPEVVRAIDAAAKAEAGGLAAGARRRKKGEAKEDNAGASAAAKGGGRPATPPNAEAAHEKGERWWEVHGYVPVKDAPVPQGYDLSGIADPILAGLKRAHSPSPAGAAPPSPERQRSPSPVRGAARSMSPLPLALQGAQGQAAAVEGVPPMSPPGFSPAGLKDAPHIEVRQGRNVLKYRTMSRGMQQSVDDLMQRATESAQLPVHPHLRVLALGAAASDRALPVKLSALRPIPVVGFPVPREVWYPGMPTEEERQAAREEYRERRGKPKPQTDDEDEEGEEGKKAKKEGAVELSSDHRRKRRRRAVKEKAAADLTAWKRRKWSTGSPVSSRGGSPVSASRSPSRSRSPTPYKPTSAASEGHPHARAHHHHTSHREAAAAAVAAMDRQTPESHASRPNPIVAVTNRVGGLVTAVFGQKHGGPEEGDFLPVSTMSSVFSAAAEGGAGVGTHYVPLPVSVLPQGQEGNEPPGSAGSDGEGSYGSRSELVTPSEGGSHSRHSAVTPGSRAGLLTPSTGAGGGAGGLKGKLVWSSRKVSGQGDQRRSRKSSSRLELQSRLGSSSSSSSKHYNKEGGLWGMMAVAADAAQDATLAGSESSEEEDEALPLLLDELVESLTRAWTRLKYPGTDRTQKIIVYSQNHLVLRMQEAVLLWTEAADAIEALVGGRAWLRDIRTAVRDSQAALEAAEAAAAAKKAGGGGAGGGDRNGAAAAAAAAEKAAAAAKAASKVAPLPAATGSAALRAMPTGLHAPLARGVGALPTRMLPHNNANLAILKQVTPGAKPIISPEMAAVNHVPLVMVPILSHALISYLSALCVGAEAYLGQSADLNAGLRAVAGLPRHEAGTGEWSVGPTPGAPSPLLTYPRVALPATARLLRSLEGLDALGNGLMGALEHRVEDACARVSESFPEEEVFYRAQSYRRLLAAGVGR